MPSHAYADWTTDRSWALDEMEATHRVVRGSGSRRRQAIQQINQAYAVFLSSQFQGFCRDLHADCSVLLGQTATTPLSQHIYAQALQVGRKLDSGNANAWNLAADFGRFGFSFWPKVEAEDPRNPDRRALLEEMNRWRNAIAHNSFAPDMCRRGEPKLTLAVVQDWRRACNGLARSFDRVLCAYLLTVTGTPPW